MSTQTIAPTAVAAPAAPPPTPPSLWRDRRFTAFWSGYTLSQFGDRITELALPLIAVIALNATASQIGLLTAAIWLPNLLAMFVGTWIDRRLRKRRILVAADLLRAGVLILLPLAYWQDMLSMQLLYGIALLTGIGGVIFNMAYPAFYVSLVRPESYIDANSKLDTARATSHVAGPAIGGALIRAVTAPVAVLVDAVSFLVSAAVIGRLQLEDRPVPAEPSPKLFRQAVQGLRFVIRHPVLRATLGGSTTINFFTFMAQGLIILFASRALGLSEAVIGIVFAVGAAGGIVGAVLAPWVARLLGVGRTILLGAVLFPAPIALLAVASGSTPTVAAVLCASELLASIGVMLLDVNQNAVQTAVTPDGMRGRRAGAFATVNYGSRPLGAVAGGLLATAIGLRPTFLVAAIGGTLAAIWYLRSPIPRLRTIADADAYRDV